MVESKPCSKCLQTKPLQDFAINSKGLRGRKSVCKVCSNEAQILLSKKRKEANPEKVRLDRYLKHLKVEYNLTLETYYKILEVQGGVCAICGIEHEKYIEQDAIHNFFCVDHDHNSGQVRGLLCRNCNSGLGKLKDSKELLKRAIKFLDKPPFKKVK